MRLKDRRKAQWMLGFFLLVGCTVYGQQKARTDSLERVYNAGAYDPRDRLKILKELAMNHPDTDRKLHFSAELVEVAGASDSTDYLIHGLHQQGNAYRLISELSEALESYFQEAKIAGEKKLDRRLGVAYTGIADVYATMGNHTNAVRYYRMAIRILREKRDSVALAAALLNIGDEYITTQKLDSALMFTEEAGLIYEKSKSPDGEAYSLGNLGMIYAQMGDDRKAEENMNEAIVLLEGLDDYYPITVYLRYIADIYLDQGEDGTALRYAFRSLELAKQYGLKEQISDANLKISQIYEKVGQIGPSFQYYKEHIAYKDSVSDITSVQQMADLRTDFEVSRKQIEVDLLNQQKRNQQIIVIGAGIAFFLICLLAYGLYRRYKFTRETSVIIEKEKERSDSLLLNILPKETANELKQSGKVQAKKFDSVTVLFADFKGFTQYAEKWSPEKLVERVDFYFSRFDAIMEKHGLEKIKTLGDAYMCAGGLPFPSGDHALRMTRAAIEMIAFVKESKISGDGTEAFDIRVGINSGPVVAGVVGTKKFAYDIWGDTVNIASRMETSSEPGRINVSESTYALIKDEFDCEYRGEMDVRNKGMMRMYFVRG